MANTQKWGFGNLGAKSNILTPPSKKYSIFDAPRKRYESLGQVPAQPQPVQPQPVQQVQPPQPAQQTQPIKKHVTVDPNGNRSEIHYDTQPVKSTQQDQYKNVQSGTDSSGNPIYYSGLVGTQPSTQPQQPQQPQQPVQQSTYEGLISKLSDIATKPNPLLTQDIATQQRLANEYGKALATVTNTPGLLANQNIRASNITQAYGQQMQGLGTNINALQALQGVQQAGVLGAAGLTPEALRYGGTAGGALNPLNNLESITQQVLSGQISPAQAKAMGSTIPTWNGALNQALITKDPNYNEGTTQAKFDANQANIQTGGVAPVTAANTVYQKANSEYQDLKQSVQNVHSFGTLLTSGMVAKDGTAINPSSIKWGNMALSEVRNQISDSQQAQFDSTYAALKSKISGLLSVGGNEIPTQITKDANSILSGQAPLKTIADTLKRIKSEGDILLRTQAQKVNTALSQVQGTSSKAQTATNKSADVFSDANFF